MIVYLVRHARAGSRDDWEGDDRLRPLDEKGRRQAEALVGQLDGRELGRIVSSPYVRCVESVEPLARARGLELETSHALAEGVPFEEAFELFRSAGEPLVASVHGDLAHAVLGEKLKKGATAVLDFDDAGGPRVLERFPPQA